MVTRDEIDQVRQTLLRNRVALQQEQAGVQAHREAMIEYTQLMMQLNNYSKIGLKKMDGHLEPIQDTMIQKRLHTTVKTYLLI